MMSQAELEAALRDVDQAAVKLLELEVEIPQVSEATRCVIQAQIKLARAAGWPERQV